MLEHLKDINIKNLTSMVQLILLFPIFIWIKNMFLYDNLDIVMQSRPKKRFTSIVNNIKILIFLIFFNMLSFFQVIYIFPSFNINNELIINVLELFLTFSIYLLIYCFIICFWTYTKYSNIYQVLLFFLTISLAINFAKNYNPILPVLFLCLSIFLFYKAYKNRQYVYNFVNGVYFAFIVLISYLVCVLISYLPIKFAQDSSHYINNTIIFNFTITVALFIMITVYLYENRKIQYFYPNKELIDKYNIDITTKNQKFYIYYTTNEKYFVCGIDKIFTYSCTRYLFEYNDVIKCGGFSNERIIDIQVV